MPSFRAPAALPLALGLLCLLAAAGGASADSQETMEDAHPPLYNASYACSMMPPAWMMHNETMPPPMEVTMAVYKECLSRYNASNLNYTWTPWVCEEPTIEAWGCYQPTDWYTNYMIYLNCTCTTPATATEPEKTAKMGMTADASWNKADGSVKVMDVDVEGLWVDGVMMMGEEEEKMKSVWWEKNDGYWYYEEPEAPPPPAMDAPMDWSPPPASVPSGGGY